jgi:RND family efflux transporter MFP subunit
MAVSAWAGDVPFPTLAAELRPVPRERVLDGIVEAVNETTVSAQTSGTVTDVYFDVNDFVANGVVLLRISTAEQQAALDQARAALAEAQARHREAAADFARTEEVYQKGATSKAEFDKADAALKATQARLEAAHAGVAQAERQLDYTTVSAPYSGIVTTRHVDVGEQVRPGAPLLTGISLEELRVAVDVPQDLINEVRSVGAAQVHVPGPAAQVVTAERLTFFPYANPLSHTFKLRAYLPSGVDGLYPGMYVKVGFVVGERPRLLIPEQAVVHRGEMTGTYVVASDGRVTLRLLRVGRPVDEDMIEILAGLDAGELVAVDPIAAGVYLKEQARGESHE